MGVRQVYICDVCEKREEQGAHRCASPGCQANHGGAPADWFSILLTDGGQQGVGVSMLCCSEDCGRKGFEKSLRELDYAKKIREEQRRAIFEQTAPMPMPPAQTPRPPKRNKPD